jgi:hypothetical protein
MKYLKPLQYLFFIIQSPFLPSNWRAVFMGRMKIAVYLEGGQKFYLYVTHFKVTLGKENASYTFDGLTEHVLVRPTDIVAVREVNWFR